MGGDLGKISEDEVHRRLDRHDLWLRTDRKGGQRAEFSGWDMFAQHLLAGRNLSEALCINTEFGAYTSLDENILRKADLRGATFDGTTQLHATDFRGAIMDEKTIFDDADLSNIIANTEDFTRVNLLKMQRNKLPVVLHSLFDKQTKQAKQIQQSWIDAFDAAGRGRGRGKRPGPGKSRFDL